jgi:hypothetical protein
MINDVAPVLIPTLNRFVHFKSCINSLLECELSEETDLFIALDYPLRNNHWEGFNKIKEFITQIEGFKSVYVIKRECNFGAHRNIHDAIDFLFKKYETLILTEDDNVFSNDFLVYTNKCLETYNDNNNIFSVCGYNYPVEMLKFYENEIYSWQGYSAWGVGLWRNKFLKINWSEEVVLSNVKNFLNDYKKVIQLDKIANHYIPALLHMYNIQQVHGDTYISMHQFLNNMTSIFPVISRVRNMGHDGSGINCGVMENDIFAVQDIYSGSNNYEIPKGISRNDDIDTLLYTHFRTQWMFKIKLVIKLVLFNLGYKSAK